MRRPLAPSLAIALALGLASCAAPQEEAPSATTPPVITTKTPTPEVTTALGTSSCDVIPPESQSTRPPVVIVSGKAEVFQESTRITLATSGSLESKTFEGSLGAATVRDYGLRIYSPKEGRSVVYSLKNNLEQLYDGAGKPVASPNLITLVAEGQAVELTLPTAALPLEAKAWAVELFSLENDRTRRSFCYYGQEAFEQVKEQPILKPESTSSNSF